MSMRVVVHILLACSLCLAQARKQAPATANPHSAPEDVARGERLFQGACASCHGPRGEGGRGANLAVPRLSRATNDEALFNIIQDGIQGTEMPRAWSMTDREIWQVAAFVRTLGRIVPQAIPGDRARGEQLFRTKGNCLQCHIVAGQGGLMGPELTEIGARRNPSYLRTAVLDPEADLPPSFLQVRVVTRDGRKMTGLRLNEDTFSIQIRDYSDRLYSFWKSELVELHRDRGKSPMPPYRGVFTAAELDDLVAYLASLRGGL